MFAICFWLRMTSMASQTYWTTFGSACLFFTTRDMISLFMTTVRNKDKKNIDQQLFCFCLINEQKLTGKQNTNRHADCFNMAKITIMSITEMNCWLFNMIVQSFHQHQAFIGLEKEIFFKGTLLNFNITSVRNKYIGGGGDKSKLSSQKL